jgi:hypothetical protein
LHVRVSFGWDHPHLAALQPHVPQEQAHPVGTAPVSSQ